MKPPKILTEFFNKAAEHASLSRMTWMVSVLQTTAYLSQDNYTPAQSAAACALIGITVNSRKDQTKLFNLEAFNRDNLKKMTAGKAFLAGASIGALTGEFVKAMTGSNLAGNLLAVPLSFGVSTVAALIPPAPKA